jgi:hypothetical protein
MSLEDIVTPVVSQLSSLALLSTHSTPERLLSFGLTSKDACEWLSSTAVYCRNCPEFANKADSAAVKVDAGSSVKNRVEEEIYQWSGVYRSKLWY